MSSQIKNIYSAFSAMDVTLDGEIVPVKKPETLPNSIQTANLPLRLLTPLQPFIPNFSTSSSWNAGVGSSVNQVNWIVTDIFLSDAMNQNIGIRAHADTLIDYCVAYIEAMNDGSLALPNNTMITNYTTRPDVINYPIGSQYWYYGVFCYINILEKIP